MGVGATFFPIHLNHVVVLGFPFLAKNAYDYLDIKTQYWNRFQIRKCKPIPRNMFKAINVILQQKLE
jgi:hypothetical protein